MRILNRPLALLLAIVLAIAGVILVVEVIALAVNAKPVLVHWDSWYRWANRTKWKSGVIRFWAVVLIVVGLLLLSLQLKPRRTTRMTITSVDPATDAAITSAGLRQALSRAATSVDGVSAATVATSKRRVTVTARTAGHASETADPLKEPVTTAVQNTLNSLDLTKPPRLSVRMTTPERLMHADRTNRTMLTLLGVLCLVTGVGALLASLGIFSTALKNKPLFNNQISKYIGHHGSWIWAAAAVLAALLVLFCLAWLRTLLFSTDRSGDLTTRGDRRRGTTVIRPGALTDAISTEIGTYRGVDSAKARLIGDSDAPTVVVAVTAAANTDLTQLRHRIETGALAHARQALTNPELPVQLDLAVSKGTASRIR